MQTDDLIRALAGNLAPVPSGLAQRRITLGIAAGSAVTLAAIALVLGFRPDMGTAMQAFPFWMKWAYTISLGAGALVATIHLSRPETRRLSGLWLLAVPFVSLAVLALLELLRAPPGTWQGLWLGRSEGKCAMLVMMLSLPILGGLVWSFRQLAPGNLRLAGAMAGLASGAGAATLYGLHCPEASAMFVLVWYTLGITLASVIGMLAGPRLLRW